MSNDKLLFISKKTDLFKFQENIKRCIINACNISNKMSFVCIDKVHNNTKRTTIKQLIIYMQNAINYCHKMKTQQLAYNLTISYL